MTWGQLRLQLQISAPGVSLDLLDEYLNGRYEQILEETDWIGLKGHSTIQTTAAIQTGTVTLTVGSTGVTGASTAWSSGITGMRLYRPGDTIYYTVTYVSATSLTLDRAYEGVGTENAGTVYSAAQYVLMQHIYALPSDLGSVVEISNPVSGFPLNQMSKSQLDVSAGPRTLIADPGAFAIYDDSPEASPPVVHQIEFYPPPLHSRGYPLAYSRNANRFDGSSTTLSPLPFVSNSSLLLGSRADAEAYMASRAAERGDTAVASAHLALAMKYEAKFEDEIGRMLQDEHAQRRPKVAMKMADRFTRHRSARATRGSRGAWGIGAGGPN